jgi:alcohol dehydrogenase class IV
MKKATFDLRKFVAPEFIVGIDARKLAGRYAKNLGANEVLVVTDPAVKSAPWFRDIIAALETEGMGITIFSDVSSNPRAAEVAAGTAVFERSRCDTLVAVGGGSPIDCAKGIGIMASNKQDILEFEGVDNILIPPPPIVCIPTTSGSGADVSQFAVINDTTRRVKITIISKKIVPDIALLDPVPLTTLPSELTTYTGLDAITHSVEAYVSNASSPVTDIHALESIRLMNTWLVKANKAPDNLEYRYQTMMSSLLAGIAFSNASLGAVHAMAHSLGGFSDLPHGKCNALLLEHVTEYNYAACPDRYRTIAAVMHSDAPGPAASPGAGAEGIISAIRSLRESLHATETLGDLGVTQRDIPELAGKAIRDPCMATNPRRPTQRDIEEIYERAL